MSRHRWTQPTCPDLNNTFRTCVKCGLVKITRHEPDNTPRHWPEFQFEGKRVAIVDEPNKTPPCGGYKPTLTSVPA